MTTIREFEELTNEEKAVMKDLFVANVIKNMPEESKNYYFHKGQPEYESIVKGTKATRNSKMFYVYFRYESYKNRYRILVETGSRSTRYLDVLIDLEEIDKLLGVN